MLPPKGDLDRESVSRHLMDQHLHFLVRWPTFDCGEHLDFEPCLDIHFDGLRDYWNHHVEASAINRGIHIAQVEILVFLVPPALLYCLRHLGGSIVVSLSLDDFVGFSCLRSLLMHIFLINRLLTMYVVYQTDIAKVLVHALVYSYNDSPYVVGTQCHHQRGNYI